MTEQFRPTPDSVRKQNAPEAGAGPIGLPPGPEQQPLPGVWDVLEREVRLNAPDVEVRPRWGSQEYERQFDEMARLQEELMEIGTIRDNLILD
jgi:hypothetical protein